MEAVELEVVEGFPTQVVAFGTDIPHFRFSGRVQESSFIDCFDDSFVWRGHRLYYGVPAAFEMLMEPMKRLLLQTLSKL